MKAVVQNAVATIVEKGKKLSLGDWGSIASLLAVGLWIYDHTRKRTVKVKLQR